LSNFVLFRKGILIKIVFVSLGRLNFVQFIISFAPSAIVGAEVATDDAASLLIQPLFSWRYNPSWFYFHSPVAGFSLLVFEVS